MEIKRGYVKWTDENGVAHKEPLADHPELLESASPQEQLRAEEVRRMNLAAEEYLKEKEDETDENALDTLDALREAPEDVLNAAALVGTLDEAEAETEEPVVPETEPASAVSEPVAEKPVDFTKQLHEVSVE